MFTANFCCTLFLCWLFDTGLFHTRVEHWQIPLRPTPDCQFSVKLVCRCCCLYLLYLPKPTTRTNSFLSLQVTWDNLYVQKRCYYTRTDWPLHTWLKFQAQFVGNINTGCWPLLSLSRLASFVMQLCEYDLYFIDWVYSLRPLCLQDNLGAIDYCCILAKVALLVQKEDNSERSRLRDTKNEWS